MKHSYQRGEVKNPGQTGLLEKTPIVLVTLVKEDTSSFGHVEVEVLPPPKNAVKKEEVKIPVGTTDRGEITLTTSHQEARKNMARGLKGTRDLLLFLENN